jgi:P-aminobenzoate N-oxygenase AurF
MSAAQEQRPSHTALVERLEVASQRYRDPLREIDWNTLDPSRPWLPEHLVSLYGTVEYAGLSPEQKLRLSQAEFVSFTVIGLWLESFLLAAFTREALRQFRSDLLAYRYQLHELREEIGHSLMFLELMRRSGFAVPVPSGWRADLASALSWVISPEKPLFWAGSFICEEVPNNFNRLVLADPSLPAAVRGMVRLHVREETRHVAYARLRLIQDLPRLGRARRALYGPALRLGAGQFVRGCFYPSRQVYAAAGIADAAKAAAAARANPARAALVAQCLGPIRQFLREHQLYI